MSNASKIFPSFSAALDSVIADTHTQNGEPMPRNTVYDRLGYTRLCAGEGLRPVLRYARVSPVSVVTIGYSDAAFTKGRYSVVFYFDDGATCETFWQDWRVLFDWLAARRSWSVERVTRKTNAPAIPYTDAGLARLRAKGTVTTGFAA